MDKEDLHLLLTTLLLLLVFGWLASHFPPEACPNSTPTALDPTLFSNWAH